MLAIMFLDNAPSHPNTSKLCNQDCKIWWCAFKTLTTSLIQPTDQGVIYASLFGAVNYVQTLYWENSTKWFFRCCSFITKIVAGKKYCILYTFSFVIWTRHTTGLNEYTTATLLLWSHFSMLQHFPVFPTEIIITLHYYGYSIYLNGRRSLSLKLGA